MLPELLWVRIRSRFVVVHVRERITDKVWTRPAPDFKCRVQPYQRLLGLTILPGIAGESIGLKRFASFLDRIHLVGKDRGDAILPCVYASLFRLFLAPIRVIYDQYLLIKLMRLQMNDVRYSPYAEFAAVIRLFP